MGRKFFVVGNWKCNVMNVDLKSIASYISLGNVTTPNPVGEVWSGPYMTYWWPEADVVISPPSVFLQYVKRWMRPDFHLAAQNCCGGGGAFTGEISAETLNDVGVPWVILGHTERRAFCGESNEFVGDKVAYALSHGLKVIACVGETLEQREAGSTMEVVTAQTKAIAEKVKDWTNIVLAYGPVWAIGTGKVASPAQAQEVHCELRKWLHANTSPEIAATTRIIYGGSVNGANCKELAGQPDVDGFLVGGASLQTDFIDIVNAAAAAAEADGAAVSAWASDEFRAGFATGTMFVVLICFGRCLIKSACRKRSKGTAVRK